MVCGVGTMCGCGACGGMSGGPQSNGLTVWECGTNITLCASTPKNCARTETGPKAQKPRAISDPRFAGNRAGLDQIHL